jgi:hypothetical protein
MRGEEFYFLLISVYHWIIRNVSQVENRDASTCRRTIDVLLQNIKLKYWARGWLDIFGGPRKDVVASKRQEAKTVYLGRQIYFLLHICRFKMHTSDM